MTRPASVDALLAIHPDLLLRELELLDGSVQGAVFGPAGDDGEFESSLYRYVLWRIWGRGGRYLVALMLNPSTATHLDDDNTVDRMTTRAFRLGYDGLIVVNAFAWRDTLPRDMRQAVDPIGPANDDAVDLVVDEGQLVICGWGANGDHLGRAPAMARRLEARGVALHCLGRVASGHPEHPLYLSFSRKPVPWSTSFLTR
jgi:hypothetical protein